MSSSKTATRALGVEGLGELNLALGPVSAYITTGTWH